MTLEIGLRQDVISTGKSALSFLDLLNGATPLSPQNLGWSDPSDRIGGGGGMEASQENFSFLLGPPNPTLNSSSRGSTPPTNGDGSRRPSHSFSDTTSSSSASTNSMSMPDLHVWGIGDGNDKESSTLPLLPQLTEVKQETTPSKCRKPSSSSSSSSKWTERGSDKYKIRRERNNISVRKSRAKTKSKVRRMEDQVGRLEVENKNLRAKLGKVRKFLGDFETSFFSWRNVLREMEEELSSAISS